MDIPHIYTYVFSTNLYIYIYVYFMMTYFYLSSCMTHYRDRRILTVRKEHMKTFSEPEHSIPAKRAKDILDLVTLITTWNETAWKGYKNPLLIGDITDNLLQDRENIVSALEVVESTTPFPEAAIPGSIIKQRMAIELLQKELAASPIVLNNDEEIVVNALRYVSTLKDPLAFVASFGDSQSKDKDKDIYAWTMFNNVLRVLQEFKALDGYKPTDLGRLVGSLSGDNELWVAVTLQMDSMKDLNAAVRYILLLYYLCVLGFNVYVVIFRSWQL